MNRKDQTIGQLLKLGFSYEHALAVRRIAMTFHRWDELECGNERGCVVVEDDGKAYWQSSWGGKPQRIANREAGAEKRLAAIMASYPTLRAYHQGDPRGCPLYIIREGDVPAGEHVNSYYSRGVAICP